MTFKIIVLIKQVPDTTDIKWTAENTIQRDGLDSIVNPYDIGAVSIAIDAKKQLLQQGIDTEITAVTMGPNQAKDALYSALAYGCDKAVLLSDKRFSGADTLATAYTLFSYIKNIMGDFQLILCGQQAIDGDTAQTPSSIAQKLGITQITNVSALKEINAEYSIWNKDTTVFNQEIKSAFPILIATTLCDVDIQCKIDDYIRAQKSEITVLSADDINADSNKVGFKGSPTIVKKAYRPEISRNTEVLENYGSDEFADFILNEIENCRSIHNRRI